MRAKPGEKWDGTEAVPPIKTNIAFRFRVHQVRDWYSGVAIKMGRRQGATREHI